jgi:hypothetical protein
MKGFGFFMGAQFNECRGVSGDLQERSVHLRKMQEIMVR